MDYLQYLEGVMLRCFFMIVLNLIINGLPSILLGWNIELNDIVRFKPYYKWITFNIININLL